MVVATVEVNRFTFLVVVCSTLASAVPTAFAALILGPLAAYCMVVPVLFVIVGLALVDQRTRKGLQLRRYEAMWDKRKAKTLNSTIFVCSEPLLTPEIVTMVQTVVPNVHFRQGQPDADLYDPEALPTRSAAGIGRSTKSTAPAVRSFLE